MLARSSARDPARVAVAVSLALVAACSTKHKPEADPDRLVPIMKAMDKNTPTPGAAPTCKPEQMVGGATMTMVTLLKIAHDTANPGAEREPWSNPPELDVPAARELIDPDSDETTRRQAAFELLSAPFFLVYRVDLVDAPMAIGVKDLKRGFIGMRALRYNTKGDIECVKVMIIPNTVAKSDWAIVKSNLPVMDPKVSEGLRMDLREQMLLHIAALGRPDPT